MTEDSVSPLKKVTEGAGVVFFGTMLELGIAFVGKAIIARFLEVNQYGAISLGIIALNATATIGLLGMDRGVARFIPRFDTQAAQEAIITTGFRLVLVLASFCAVALFIFAEQISILLFNDRALIPVLKVMAVGVPFWALFELGIGVTRGLKIARFRVYTKNVFLPTARLLMFALVVVFGHGIVGVAWAYAIAFGTTAIFIVYLVRQEVAISLTYPIDESARIGQLLSYSIPLTVSDLSGYVLRNVDLVLLGAIRNTDEVGIYNVAYPLARLMSAIQGSFGFLLLPVISDLQSDGRMDEVERMYKVIVKWITYISLPPFIAMVVFPVPLLSLMFGAKYSAGGTTLAVLATGFFFGSFMGPSGNTLKAIGRTRVTVLMTWTSLGTNLILNLILIPTYGFLGAGIATMASIATSNILGTGFLYHFTDIHPFSRPTIQPVAITIGVVSAVGLSIRYLAGVNLPIVIGLYALFLLVFPISILRFGGVQQEDVRLFNEVENRTGIGFGPIKRLLNEVMD